MKNLKTYRVTGEITLKVDATLDSPDSHTAVKDAISEALVIKDIVDEDIEVEKL